MSLIAWLIVGLIAGFLGSQIVNKRGEGVVLDIVLGVVGAFVGGFISTSLGMGRVDGINLGSILIATVGAVVVLVGYHAIRGAGHRTALAGGRLSARSRSRFLRRASTMSCAARNAVNAGAGL